MISIDKLATRLWSPKPKQIKATYFTENELTGVCGLEYLHSIDGFVGILRFSSIVADETSYDVVLYVWNSNLTILQKVLFEYQYYETIYLLYDLLNHPCKYHRQL